MRVLVAEDDPDVGADLDQALGEAGFTVELVVDGNDVWSRGGVEDFALVVLDLGLPSLDGLAILRRWRAEGRSFRSSSSLPGETGLKRSKASRRVQMITWRSRSPWGNWLHAHAR